MPALELARRIRERELTSEEVTRLFLQRIDRYNPALSAFTSVLSRRALMSARARDKALCERPAAALPVLYGVPTGIKDLVPMRGTFTRLGSRAFRYFLSPFDAPTTKLLKAGGLVVLGKLATSELGALPVTEPAIHEPTRNPHDRAYTAGGSSGGSGAAVAGGLLPIAQGSDGGGSVRIPSAFCHLYGFKPSRWLLGNLHGATNVLGLSVMGPMSHTVEDAAAMLDVLGARPDPEGGEETCLDHCRRAPRSLLVRVCTESPICKTHPGVVAAVERVARALEDLGHRVERRDGVAGSAEEFLPIWQRQMAIVPVVSERLLQPMTRWLRQGGRRLDPKAVLARRDDIARRVLDHFGDSDILLTPTVPVLPPRVGALDRLAPREVYDAISPIGAFTALYNVSGQPAASIPAGFVDGLPIGVQIVGRRRGDHEVLALSRQLEQALPWPRVLPPAFA